jgi:hypothetical protein
MRVAMLGLFAGLALLALPATAQTADPLAPAREGRLQCFEPNVAAKTCQSISGYTFQANGVIDNPAQVLINPSPAIIMYITSPVAVRNNAICGPFAAADLQRATFTVGGAAANDADTADIRSALTQQLAPMIGRETCMTLTPDGDGFRAETTIGGTPQPQQTQRVIWIGANDGYRVAP